MARFGDLVREIRRRRVFRAAGIYIVASWVAVQVASLVFPAIDVPESAIRYVWLTVVLLFPLALVFAWLFEFTASGLERTAPANADDRVDLSLRAVDRVILVALALVGTTIVWQLSSNIQSVAPGAESGVVLDVDAAPNSIAVLPLANASGDEEQQYFVSGMHDALISGLSRIRDLRVTSKTSTMRFAGSPDRPSDIATELGVSRLIEGSVFRVNDRVRITVQLIDAALNRQIWSQSFEDDYRDVLRLQGDISQAIAEQVQVVVSDETKASFAGARTVDPAAHEALLRGQFHVERFTPQDMMIAARYYQQAVELDPDYALAYYGLSKLCGFRAQAGIITPQEASEQCLPPVLRALELDPDLPEAHMVYASHMTWQRFDWEEAAKGFDRAIELNPSYAEARMFYSHYLALMGRAEESKVQMRRALELDPFNPFVRGLYGAQLVMIDDFQGSIDVVEEVMQTTPGFGFGYNVLWQSYYQLGMTDQALKAAASFYRYTQGDDTGADALENAYQNGDYQSAISQAALVLEEYSKEAHVAPMFIGKMYEQHGDYERAIDWYETAFEKRDPDAPYMAVITHSSDLHSHPRFIQLLQDMKHYYWAGLFARQREN